MMKRHLLVSLVLGLMVALVCAPASLAKEYYFGHDSLYMGDEWMKVCDKAIHFYAQDQGWRVITQNADFKVEDQIKQLRYLDWGRRHYLVTVDPRLQLQS